MESVTCKLWTPQNFNCFIKLIDLVHELADSKIIIKKYVKYFLEPTTGINVQFWKFLPIPEMEINVTIVFKIWIKY